jgi:hypothetical protein
MFCRRRQLGHKKEKMAEWIKVHKHADARRKA